MTQPLAVIIGVGPSIGMGVALRFGREGWRLVLVARREEALQDYVVQLKQEGLTAHAYATDAGDFASLTHTLNSIEQEHGPAGMMLYNAVYPLHGSAITVDVNAVMDAMRVNLGGAMVVTQAAARQMTNGGTLLFTGSGLALTPYADYVGMGVGKAARRYWVLGTAESLKPQGIHAATITIVGYGVDPDQIASLYWDLHQQSPDSWQTEVVFQQ
jgi:NAD(P)-dependent dehydrogenase (short-subunit alcohol dehydrogenase family)